jgi:hypothetical protein
MPWNGPFSWPKRRAILPAPSLFGAVKAKYFHRRRGHRQTRHFGLTASSVIHHFLAPAVIASQRRSKDCDALVTTSQRRSAQDAPSNHEIRLPCAAVLFLIIFSIQCQQQWSSAAGASSSSQSSHSSLGIDEHAEPFVGGRRQAPPNLRHDADTHANGTG